MSYINRIVFWIRFQWWKYQGLFWHLENHGVLDVDNEKQMYVLHMVYLPRLNRELKEWQDVWNNHFLREMKNRSPLQLWHADRIVNRNYAHLKQFGYHTKRSGKTMQRILWSKPVIRSWWYWNRYKPHSSTITRNLDDCAGNGCWGNALIWQ